MKAVIIAGGHGKRMRPLTENVPKTMVEVGGKPFIDWIIKWFMSCGVNDFVLLVGYKKEVLMEHLDSKKDELGISVRYSAEEVPLGTGGALKNAQHLLDCEKEFAVVNSDFVTNIDIRKLSLRNGAVASVAIMPMKSPYGIVEMQGDLITRFRQKPVLNDVLMNAGIYVMSDKMFGYLPDKGEFETHGFPELVAQGKLNGYNFAGSYWRTADTIKEVEEINADIQGGVVFK